MVQYWSQLIQSCHTAKMQVTLKCDSICYRVANLTWGARVRVQCSGEERSAVCPAGVARMDGYLVKMEAAFEVMRGAKERRRNVPE